MCKRLGSIVYSFVLMKMECTYIRLLKCSDFSTVVRKVTFDSHNSDTSDKLYVLKMNLIIILIMIMIVIKNIKSNKY